MKIKNIFLSVAYMITIISISKTYAFDVDDNSDVSMTEPEELTLEDVIYPGDYARLLFKAYDINRMSLDELETNRKLLNMAIARLEKQKIKFNLNKNSIGSDRIVFQQISNIENNLIMRRNFIATKIDTFDSTPKKTKVSSFRKDEYSNN